MVVEGLISSSFENKKNKLWFCLVSYKAEIDPRQLKIQFVRNCIVTNFEIMF